MKEEGEDGGEEGNWNLVEEKKVIQMNVRLTVLFFRKRRKDMVVVENAAFV